MRHQAALVSDENANDEDYSEILQGLLQLQAAGKHEDSDDFVWDMETDVEDAEDKGVVEDEDAIPEWEDEAVTFVADELLTKLRKEVEHFL